MANILLIEDEPLVAATIEVVLMKAGHTVTRANNGEAGLAKYAEATPDLVITDIIMPQKEGIETIRDLRTKSADIPIIAISGAAAPRVSTSYAWRTNWGPMRCCVNRSPMPNWLRWWRVASIGSRHNFLVRRGLTRA